MNATAREPDLRIKEAAAEIAVSPRTVWDLIREGELQSYKIGPRSRRVTRESLDAFRERRIVRRGDAA
ncbi:helix-turn-helix domain-containing protein [Ruegeria sp. HKCCD7318]|uniref:helix-turn-helix domain-containing protein n=1 Tax=Ruegeria sp. HKCCD7318 TaxID=2683014 RepID=UPI00149204F4|nr:helix-turn-helix domain-containing protein [Ruegeria sp. HKCCD7318]NOE33871.1 helix-turn-helix domain-containing protein [Ruegeria sp. HKCCD7318]